MSRQTKSSTTTCAPLFVKADRGSQAPSTTPSGRMGGLGGFDAALHVLPISFVQVVDFATDLFVVAELFQASLFISCGVLRAATPRSTQPSPKE